MTSRSRKPGPNKMLFNSVEFIFIFLPVTIIIYYCISVRQALKKYNIYWLLAASLVFYAYGSMSYLTLLSFSVVFNYVAGYAIAIKYERFKKQITLFAIVVNLSLLAWFKYSGFIGNQFNALGMDLAVPDMALPLAISFFTFQQIEYVVDAKRHHICESSFPRYALFVVFFPHLIAGPIVHPWILLPQLKKKMGAFDWANLSMAFIFFSVGLFKKVILADKVAQYSTPIFDAAANELVPTWIEAWVGALAYTCQIYFDFSGYSDMAIGLAFAFGFRLPENFRSPYKARSIIEFWQRWHMTLSQFLREYLYIPLGGNRRGKARRYANLLITMFLGGLWHGAGWTFVIWGALHGIYLMINHAWRYLFGNASNGGLASRLLAGGVTFLAIVTAWVFFRAKNIDAALTMLKSMYGFHGIFLPVILEPMIETAAPGLFQFDSLFGSRLIDDPVMACLLIAGLLASCFLLPNLQTLTGWTTPTAKNSDSAVSETVAIPGLKIFVVAVLAFTSAILSLSNTSEFIYFNF
jgi:alginate O-acetyltransferase complex protein AlgI